LSWIYRILLHLPERATRYELRAMLPGVDLDRYFASHREPVDGVYPIRGVVLYGLAECERSRLYPRLLEDGAVGEIGRMMAVSHDGDRVSALDGGGRRVPYSAPVSNCHLLGLMSKLESGLLDDVHAAQLEWQPGAYGCSIPEIDAMADLAGNLDGVAGAQLAGAGLGGCMMVLARRDAVPALRERLVNEYYRPQAKDPRVLICRPVAGSGVIMMG
jgi:hypothetical protein